MTLMNCTASGHFGVRTVFVIDIFAAMAVFLASKHGQNIAGQTINVDGGYAMHW
jgi:enoyl-[acyl-carrier-protein] reductase (NADH)